jgi:hypothetical protein
MRGGSLKKRRRFLPRQFVPKMHSAARDLQFKFQRAAKSGAARYGPRCGSGCVKRASGCDEIDADIGAGLIPEGRPFDVMWWILKLRREKSHVQQGRSG